jgi:uncharacterized protein
MKLSRYHVLSPPVYDEQAGVNKQVVFSTRTAEPRVVDQATWQSVAAGRFDELPPALLFELVNLELLVPDDEDELALIIEQNNAAAQEDDNLYLVIQPTAWCQLGCDYCGQKHFTKQLSLDHQLRFVERARQKLAARRYKTLELSWFGGEPLAGLRVIRSLTPRLQELTQEFGVKYLAKVTTNGLTLSPAVATELVQQLGVGAIEVTLDGTAEYHDLRRHRKNGKATFDRIFANVLHLAQRTDLAVNLTLRCNVDRRNYAGVSPLLQMLAAAGVQRKLSFYVAPVHSWGNDAHQESLSAEEFAAWEINWFVEMYELGFAPSLLPKRRPIVCFAVSPDAELVDAKGELFNCTEVSYVPKYGEPNEYAIGTVEAGELPGKRARLADFNSRVRQGEYDCSDCRMLPVCGGRCPKLWQEGIPPCPTAKFNIETRLLLKYAMFRLEQQAAQPETATAA